MNVDTFYSERILYIEPEGTENTNGEGGWET